MKLETGGVERGDAKEDHPRRRAPLLGDDASCRALVDPGERRVTLVASPPRDESLLHACHAFSSMREDASKVGSPAPFAAYVASAPLPTSLDRAILRRRVMRHVRFSYRDDTGRSQADLRSRDIDVDGPSWSDIEAGIQRLDGRYFTSASITVGESDAQRLMALSGGRDGRVVCSIARPEAPDGPDEQFLSDPALGDAEFEQAIAGVGTMLPERWSVGREAALRAARDFFANEGAPDPSLTWEHA